MSINESTVLTNMLQRLITMTQPQERLLWAQSVINGGVTDSAPYTSSVMVQNVNAGGCTVQPTASTLMIGGNPPMFIPPR